MANFDPRTEREKYLWWLETYDIGLAIQMKRNKLTKTFMVILYLKNPFGLHGLYKIISAL